MSLTSYRAALPRDRAALCGGGFPVGSFEVGSVGMVIVLRDCLRFFPGLAVTYSPTS